MAGQALAERIETLPEFRAARRVALFASLAEEIPTNPVAERAHRAGKTLLWPRIEGDALAFAAAAPTALRPGAFGIPEPAGPAVPLRKGDLVLVPGLAFDATGGRLGRGRGFYDRALGREETSPALRFGVGYAFQLVAVVPMTARDRRLAGVLTDAAIIRATGREREQ